MKPTPRLPKGFDNVYEPAEDSFFLLDCLEKDETFIRELAESVESPLVIAELGTGSGIVSSFVPQVINSKYIPIASDINPAACHSAIEAWNLNWALDKSIPLEVVRGSLLDWIRPGLIDILLFNPPYVPSEEIPKPPPATSDEQELKDDRWVDLALDGGEDGMKITNNLLNELDSKLSPHGVAYILFCASNHPDLVCEKMRASGWSSEHIDTRRAGWEILSVYRFSRG